MGSPESQTDVTVAEMLRRIGARRTELDALLADLDDELTSNGWTRAEHMAHVAAWENSALALLAGEPRHAHLGITPEQYKAMDTDAQNARIIEMFRGRPASEVRGYYESTHARLVDHIASMSDEDLKRPYSHFQPDDPPYNPSPVWPWIVGNTFEHYAEHMEIIRGASH